MKTGRHYNVVMSMVQGPDAKLAKGKSGAALSLAYNTLVNEVGAEYHVVLGLVFDGLRALTETPARKDRAVVCLIDAVGQLSDQFDLWNRLAGLRANSTTDRGFRLGRGGGTD